MTAVIRLQLRPAELEPKSTHFLPQPPMPSQPPLPSQPPPPPPQPSPVDDTIYDNGRNPSFLKSRRVASCRVAPLRETARALSDGRDARPAAQRRLTVGEITQTKSCRPPLPSVPPQPRQARRTAVPPRTLAPFSRCPAPGPARRRNPG